MIGPRFSIVIPTRNRSWTLAFALRSCLEQPFEDVEVVVGDNSDPHRAEETWRVVKDIGDPRVRYVRAPEVYAQADSWNFALRHAYGEYVTLIGDDDALFPHTLVEADRLLQVLDAKVLRWQWALYNWPGLLPHRHATSHQFSTPLPTRSSAWDCYPVQASDIIAEVANQRRHYLELPTVYNALVHQDLLDRLRSRVGRICRGWACEVHSGFLVAQEAGRFHALDAPMTIAGTSEHSNGMALLASDSTHPIANEYRQLNARVHQFHPWIPTFPTGPGIIADAYLHARQSLFPTEPCFLDRRELMTNSVRETPVASPLEWNRLLTTCQESLRDDPELSAWFAETHGRIPFEDRPSAFRQQSELGISRGRLCLDASAFGVQDVHAARDLFEKLFGIQRIGMNVRVLEAAPAGEPTLTELQEKEAVIQGLKKAADDRLALVHRLTEHVRHLDRLLAAKPVPPRSFVQRCRSKVSRLLEQVKSR